MLGDLISWASPASTFLLTVLQNHYSMNPMECTGVTGGLQTAIDVLLLSTQTAMNRSIIN
jgi:hypothetical protein